jgi:hypothetical protein
MTFFVSIAVRARISRKRDVRYNPFRAASRRQFETPAAPSMTGDHSMQRKLLNRGLAVLALAPLPIAAHAAPSCADVQSFLAGKATGVVCFHTDDLRATNPLSPPITPKDNSITTFANNSPLPGLLSGFG